MANALPHIQYDAEAGILSIRLSDEKSVDSDIQENVVVDYGCDGQLVNVDIMNISLSEFQPSADAKKLLRSFAI